MSLPEPVWISGIEIYYRENYNFNYQKIIKNKCMERRCVMQYDDYKTKYQDARKQHNIMVLVGNGFDINVLSKYRDDFIDTRYAKFYDFVKYIGYNKNNVLIHKMEEAKEIGKENWSDFEALIPEVIQNEKDCELLNVSLSELQEKFSLFLNEAVTPQIENSLGIDSTKNNWAKRSISSFVGDLDEKSFKKLKFFADLWHHDVFNFLFVNFNYTSLLDDYIYLDKRQFNPHQYKTVDTNFSFQANPNRYVNDFKDYGLKGNIVFSGYVHNRVIHPHGYQNIPRSLLFGASDDEFENDLEMRKFNKDYWTQYELNYGSLFNDTKLFIIYGSSVGESDKWWWKNICKTLEKKVETNEVSELIIYSYKIKFDVMDFLNKYASSESAKNKIKERIFNIVYGDSDEINFLSLRRQTEEDINREKFNFSKKPDSSELNFDESWENIEIEESFIDYRNINS